MVRTIQTYILRLLIDSDNPSLLRGSLHPMEEQADPLPFQDETALLTHLKRLAADPMPTAPGAKKERKGPL
jgi:hypothetical protein